MKGRWNAILIMIGLALTLFQACGNLACFQVHGPITQWTYHIADFSKIRVYNSPQIYITQGDSQSVVVESEENMFHALQFHIDPFEERLFIDFDETCIDDIDHFKIFITLDTLKEIDLRGGGEVWVQDTMITESLNLLVSGSADINFDLLDANMVTTDISGSGNVRLIGSDTAQSHKIKVSGLGSVFSFEMPCRSVDIEVSGGALIQTSVQDSLNVKITGTCDVYYKGYPSINEDITGNGQVISAN